jgi:hypothetical protein
MFFYLFCPNSPLQTLILFSLHLSGGFRHLRWSCRPRTTLRQAPTNGVPPGEAIQGNRHEFTHYTGADGHTATLCSQTTRLCIPTIRPPAPAGQTASFWSRGPKPCFGYTWTCSCNGGKTFDVNTLFCDSAGENLWLDLNQDTLPHDYFRDQ